MAHERAQLLELRVHLSVGSELHPIALASERFGLRFLGNQ